MADSLLNNLVRNFPENGPKLLLENAANVRDLLVLLHEPQVHAIDFTAMTAEVLKRLRASQGVRPGSEKWIVSGGVPGREMKRASRCKGRFPSRFVPGAN